MKILVGRLMSMEKITEQIAAEKEAYEKSITKRRELCSALGLTGQLKRCEYKLNPANFYYHISEEECNIVSKLSDCFWRSGRDDFDSCEMPDGVLEELSFMKNNNVFSWWGIHKLVNDLGFIVLGERENDNTGRFLVARWVDNDTMKSFAEMKALVVEKETEQKMQESLRLTKSYKEKVVEKVPLAYKVSAWVRDYHKGYPAAYIEITGRSFWKYHCRSRMYKVEIRDYKSSAYTSDRLVCGECGECLHA